MKLALIALVALAAAPFALAGFQVTLLTEILIFALFAMSLDVQIGYARMFSFGHVAPYGLGAYVTAFALIHGWSLPAAMGAALLAVIVFAVPVGWLCTRASGVAFAMLTLAFAQLGYAIVFKWTSLTGGSDGLSGLVRNPGPFGFDGFVSRTGFYWMTLVIIVSLLMLTRAFMRSAMGTAIVAARESERRAVALGYEPRSLRVVAFSVSNGLAGVAGALHAGFLLFVSPELLFWSLSGHVIIAVMLGGAGTLIGPMVGAAMFVIAQQQLSAVTDSWPMVMGILFIIVVIAAPKGLWGIAESLKGRNPKTSKKPTHVGGSNVTP